LLALPKLAMPTADVYRRFDELGLGRQRDIELEPPWEAWAQLPSEILLPRLVNDLERPAFEIAPPLGELRERIEKVLSRPVRMSGSGSSLFTLFDSREQASEAAETVERQMNENLNVVEVSPNIADDLAQEPA
jgi:4-diphosphocytidyl-2-C-methyl-D-erythritol kinase